MAKFFKCSKCPSFVVKLNEGGCNPSCCGEPMVELNANTVDAAKEKHVPVVKIEGNSLWRRAKRRLPLTNTAISTDFGKRNSKNILEA